MVRLGRICIQNQQISIDSFLILLVIREVVNRAFLMLKRFDWRICSTDAAFERRANELSKYQVERRYQKRFVRQQIRKAKSKTREEALTPGSQKATGRVPMVVTYHPNLPNIGYILRELQPLLHCSDKCKKAVKEFLWSLSVGLRV